MRKNILGVSGSSIYSDASKFNELYLEGIEHIEIGEFSSEGDFENFLEFNNTKSTSFGIHSPLVRSGSKYDLLEKVKFEPKYAWEQLECEAKKLSKLGAEYLLVHFPYFKGEALGDTTGIIENGLKRLKGIQDTYNIDIICEPKLGMKRCSKGIEYLQKLPKELWGKYNIGLCIDIGDYIIAMGDEIIKCLEKWKEFVRVVHLHNIHYEENNYIWTPVHPDDENDKNKHKVKEIIKFLAKCEDVIFIFEHTPETKPSTKFVMEGVKWTSNIINGDNV